MNLKVFDLKIMLYISSTFQPYQITLKVEIQLFFLSLRVFFFILQKPARKGNLVLFEDGRSKIKVLQNAYKDSLANYHTIHENWLHGQNLNKNIPFNIRTYRWFSIQGRGI